MIPLECLGNSGIKSEFFALANGLLCIETIIIVLHFPNKEKLSKELAAKRGEDRENMKLGYPNKSFYFFTTVAFNVLFSLEERIHDLKTKLNTRCRWQLICNIF